MVTVIEAMKKMTVIRSVRAMVRSMAFERWTAR